ncbi:MAG: hypothetical protein R3F62_23585 [Planctomycetota bacterium]
MSTRIALGAALLCLAGCGSLDVSSRGAMPSDLLEPVGSHPEEPLLLGCDDQGNLSLNGQPLDLPVAREPARYGVGLADAAELPPPWRPPHALTGGLLITWLHRQSPLAVAGVRPFDVLLAIDGESVDDPLRATGQLRDAGATEVEVLVRRRGSQRPEALHLRSEAPLGDLSRVSVPFLFDRREGVAGDALGVGPFSAAVWWRERRELAHELRQRTGTELPGFDSRHEAHFEWGALGNLLYWERRRDLATGEERSRFRLLWFLSFGDDL